MLSSSMWLHMLSASLLWSLAANCMGSAVGYWLILFMLCHVWIRCDMRLSAGVMRGSVLTACPQISSCSVWLSTRMWMHPTSCCQLVSLIPSCSLYVIGSCEVVVSVALSLSCCCWCFGFGLWSRCIACLS